MVKTASLISAFILLLSSPSKSLLPSLNEHQAWWYAGLGHGVTSSFTSEGVQAKVWADGTDTWNRKPLVPQVSNATPSYLSDSFTLEGGNVVSIRYRVPFYDLEGNKINSSKNGAGFDLNVLDAASGVKIASLRIWTDSNGGRSGHHSYQLGTYQAWPDGKYCGNEIIGDASVDSSFYVTFDKENLFRSYVYGEEGLRRLDNSQNDYLAAMKDEVAKHNHIKFELACDNGPVSDLCLEVLEINDQSLANSEGVFLEDIAPRIIETGVVSTTIEKDVEYTIPLKAIDVFSQPSISISYDGSKYISGTTFTPTNVKSDYKVNVKALDSGGNETIKEYSFNVISTLGKPIIDALPTIEDLSIDAFTSVEFDLPTYHEDSGNASLALKMIDPLNNEYDLSLNKDHTKFVYKFPYSSIDGQYQFIYSVTNAAGTTVAEPILVNISISKNPLVDFVNNGSSTSTFDLIEEGIRARETTSGIYTSFGTYDIKQGLSLDVTIPAITSVGLANDLSNFRIDLVNQQNHDYKVSLTYWLDNETFKTGVDAPLRAGIQQQSGGFIDLGEVGWAGRHFDNIDGKLRLDYSYEGGLRFNNKSNEMVANDHINESLVQFIATAPSRFFDIQLCINASSANNTEIEYVVNKINKQSFASTNGVINHYEDAYLVVSSLPSLIKTGSEEVIELFAADVCSSALTIDASVTKPNGAKEALVVIDNKINYLFEDNGDYEFDFSVVGKSNNRVSQKAIIEARSSIDPVDIFVGEFDTNIAQNDEFVIPEVAYSENVNVSKATITLRKPGSDDLLVQSGEKHIADVSGEYKIIFYACDDALIHANEKTVVLSFIITSSDYPVILCDIPEVGEVGKEIEISPTIEDGRECQIVISIIDPIHIRTNYYENKITFIPTKVGEYIIKIRVEDVGGLVSTFERSINISGADDNPSKPQKKGCKGSITTSSIIISSCSLLGLLTLIIKKKGTK